MDFISSGIPKGLGIVVHLGSKPGNDPIYGERAYELGSILGKRRIPLIYGGSSDGCMGKLADGCLDHGGDVTGIMPKYLQWKKERVHPRLSRIIWARSMSHRKKVMTELSIGAAVLPGSWGTLDEGFEFLTAIQLMHVMRTGDYSIRRYRGVGLLNVAGYYKGLVNWIDSKPLGEGFLEPQHREILFLKEDPNELIDRLIELYLNPPQVKVN